MNRRLRRPSLLAFYTVALLAVLVFPVVVVVASSLTTTGYAKFPPDGLTLHWYAEAWQRPEFLNALWVSLIVATLATLVSIALAVPAALGVRRSSTSLASAAETFLMSPLMLPTILLGMAMLDAYTRAGVASSPATIALGHVVIVTPYVVRMVLLSLVGVDPGIERAASDLGASPPRVFVRVILPLIKPGLLAGAVFAFIVSFDEVNVSLFLSGIQATTLPVEIFNYIQQNADPVASATSTVLIALALVLMLLADRLVGLERLFGAETPRRD